MNKTKTAVVSASMLASAALVLPALAQTATGTTDDAIENELDDGAVMETEAETAEDTGTGGTIPSELPDTGGGWGANR